MRISFKLLFADKIIKAGVLGSVVLLLLSTISVLLLYRNYPPYVPLFNQLPWGTERLGDKLLIFIPNAVVLVLLIINMFLARMLYEKMPLVARMIGITTFFISFVTFIFLVRTTLLIL